MNEKDKQEYLSKYKKAKEKGIYFFPDAIFKDAIVALIVFLILVGLAFFVGAPLEERADPSDTSYSPRPEWYFLFLFQLLKYFPGDLEVIGVVVVPTLAIILLLLLPILDRTPLRHYSSRLWVTGVTFFLGAGIIFFTFQSVLEAPPPFDSEEGDQIALLYTENCAGCHGATIIVPSGRNLHEIIVQGKHEGMPAWSADLTTDEVDALAGFILSPAGSTLFENQCGECHEAPELVSGNPIELKNALDEGMEYPAHTDVDIPEWTDIFSREERTSLVNFLVAPDGQRLYAVNCSSCHGRGIALSQDESELRELISEGGLHLEMPPWREKLNDLELDTLARYVVEPSTVAGGSIVFDQYCSSCHGELIPLVDDLSYAREIIEKGGSHETMPVWGEVLTTEQLDALAAYTLSAASGTSLESGQELYAQNCAACHGDFGEGGENPSRPDDIIAPISTSEYLKTRDDLTLRSITAQGQPNFGMSPFGSAFGGPLEDDEIDAIVAYIRSWEENPPVELPPEVNYETVSLTGNEVFEQLCAQCHDPQAGNYVEISLREKGFREDNTSQDIFNSISLGHKATSMISWGEILSSEQIQELVNYIISQPIEDEDGVASDVPAEPAIPSFSDDVMPIFEATCSFCHGTDGGWDAANYNTVMETGDNAPTIIPGDVANSLLAQKLLDIQAEGDMMPPLSKLSDRRMQIILDWIEAGAPNN